MILAGITLFNPDVARLEENISSIYGQVDRVICVDNGSDNIKSIEDCVLKNWKNILKKSAQTRFTLLSTAKSFQLATYQPAVSMK